MAFCQILNVQEKIPHTTAHAQVWSKGGCNFNIYPDLSFQLETKAGKAAAALSSTDALDPPDLKVALKREREEHQHLLAESYAAVMDQTKQVNMCEDVFLHKGLKVLK